MARDSKSTAPKTVRVAIYCRKSTEKNLDGFNSLDAQREAVENYVKSQKAKGWVVLPEKYDDAGFTGANTKRPAFQKLLQDIADGKVDVIAVYRYDRLSRSLLDFLQLLSFFKEQGVDFVSVSQNIDTTSSLGRLQANVLMSFNEYEREAISERTKDKIRAARQKGLFTGGRPPLGYDTVDKRLVVNEAEADRVREIFRLYLDFRSLLSVAKVLNHREWRNKTLRTKTGQLIPGGPFTKQTVRFLISNPLYTGKVRCNGDLVDGVHEAIIDDETFDKAQALLDSHAVRKNYRPRRSKSFLTGLLYCGACSRAMGPHYTQKKDRRYRFYVCQKAQKQGAEACPSARVPAREIEDFVVSKVMEIGKDPAMVSETLISARKQVASSLKKLTVQIQRLERKQRSLSKERDTLIDAMARGGDGAEVLGDRLQGIDDALKDTLDEARDKRREIDTLNYTTIDEGDLATALDAFIPIWNQLFPKERSRVLHLLIEKVTYNAVTGDMEINFRPGGVRALAAENEEVVV